MASSLVSAGLTSMGSPDEASLIIVNSCSFLQTAVKESLDTVFDLRTRYPGKKILLAGCLPGRYDKDTLNGLLPEVDGIFGNRSPEAVADLLTALEEGTKPAVFPSPPAAQKGTGAASSSASSVKRTVSYSFPGSSYVKLAEGCGNRCTYCAIPLIRGPLVSRSQEQVLDEIKYLLDGGVFEFNLIAQDLGSYGLDRGRQELTELLEKILRLDGKFWLRMLYLHPDHFPESLPDLCSSDSRLLPYFDLPFQHASETILGKMGRKGSAGVYLDLVRRIRDKLADAVIRSTFITGFPGETGKDFDQVLAFQREAQLTWAGIFIYSREEGTPAYGMSSRFKQNLLRGVFEKRKNLFQDLQTAITGSWLTRFKGRTMDVLIEEPVEGEDLSLGRTWLQAPEVDGSTVVRGRNLKPGSVVSCSITRVNGIDLEALV